MDESKADRKKSQLDNTVKMKAAVVIQRWWRRHSYRKNVRKIIKRLKSKYQIANELLTSERSYCEHISFIIKEVVKPSRDVIDDEELHSILFSTIEDIYQMHESFLAKLEEVMSGYEHSSTRLSPTLFSELFSKEDFKLKYSNYCANYRKSHQMAKLLFVNNTGFNTLCKKAGIMQSNAL